MKTVSVPYLRSLGVSDHSMNQSLESLDLRYARIRQFRQLSPGQQRNYVLAGKADPRADVINALRDIAEILKEIP